MNQRGYCIFVDTLCDGPAPSLYEPKNSEPDHGPLVFPTEREAQLEIVDEMMTRLQEFIDGERDFDDAVFLTEYVVEVEVTECGGIAIVDRVDDRAWQIADDDKPTQFD